MLPLSTNLFSRWSIPLISLGKSQRDLMGWVENRPCLAPVTAVFDYIHYTVYQLNELLEARARPDEPPF
jgi:hypothetical protein